jgi:hypothetical protein
MSLKPEDVGFAEKHDNTTPSYDPATLGDHKQDGHFNGDPESLVEPKENLLHKDLQGRHMQMIAMKVQHIELSSVY